MYWITCGLKFDLHIQKLGQITEYLLHNWGFYLAILLDLHATIMALCQHFYIETADPWVVHHGYLSVVNRLLP